MSTSATSSSNGNSRVAIVTGGTANLGKLFAESLAGDGVNLVVHYNSLHRAQEAADVVNEIEGLGVEAIAHQGDLTDTGQITQLVDATIDRFGKWDILVNTSGLIIRMPLETVGAKDKVDIKAKCSGGGKAGQAGALRLGIARALVKLDPENRMSLAKAGLMTRDPRMVERKKYGRSGARKRFQFSKR